MRTIRTVLLWLAAVAGVLTIGVAGSVAQYLLARCVVSL
jgi:hypothetical protein